MRRAMAAAVMGALVLGGGTATPAFAATAAKTTIGTTATTKTPASATAKKAALKTVVYHGYEFQVPASWPVYRLDQHPATCVRYDVHAVYLGPPGANMQCPPGLIGRTQTVSVIPSSTVAAGSGTEITDQREQPDGVAGAELQPLPAVHGAVTLNATQHELRVALGAASLGATVLATYGTDPAVVEQVLGTLRAAPARAPETVQTAPSPALLPSKAASVSNGPSAAEQKASSKKPGAAVTTTTSWRGVPANWPVQIVLPPPPVFRPVKGFDACTAPSLATMRVWRRQYAAIGVYIGGDNDACAYGNLSAAWIKSVANMGWGVLPSYVGPQAPCWLWSGPGARIVPRHAAAEGVTAGEDAVRDARLFGLPAGSPMYYDMESYGNSPSCGTAVLTFIGAWDRTVAAAGYVTGVYSGEDSGIQDMQAALMAKTVGFTAPDALWIASWDGVATLSDGSLGWPLDERSKQYWGNATGTVGGITLSIDEDIVGGPMAR
jgi:glycoside hydrolase-like protein